MSHWVQCFNGILFLIKHDYFDTLLTEGLQPVYQFYHVRSSNMYTTQDPSCALVLDSSSFSLLRGNYPQALGRVPVSNFGWPNVLQSHFQRAMSPVFRQCPMSSFRGYRALYVNVPIAALLHCTVIYTVIFNLCWPWNFLQGGSIPALKK